MGTGALSVVAAGLTLLATWGPAHAEPDPFAAMNALRVSPPAPVPDVTFQTFDGRPVRLAAFRGRPLVLTFFTTWWPQCRREAPAKATLYREFQARGLAMVSVSLREPADTVREWGEDLDVGFPLWLDPGGETPAAFGVRGHPSTVLIDRDGRIVGRAPGERSWSSPEARRLVEWLLHQGGR